MAWKRTEIRARQKLAASILGGFEYRAHPASPHGWLTVPEPWCVRDFVAQARMRGVILSPAEDFIAARSTSAHAVRICLGPVQDRSRLGNALTMVAEILERSPAPYQTAV
jgi:DNA-binding transcriptional MocR family regulator